MKILILGNGGREHALAWRLSLDERVDEIFCAPGSDAMPGKSVDIAFNEHRLLIDLVKTEGIELTVVGPEAALYTGVVDALRSKGLPIFGPTQAAARIEESKIYSKEMMAAAGIPTADSKTFGEVRAAMEYVEKLAGQCVVKVSGPALGKGAFVCRSEDEARDAIEEILVKKTYGDDQVLIEELMTGPEVSFYAITDGTNILPLPAAQDHKTIGEGETGPMTGGMGAYAPTPILKTEQYDEVLKTIVVPLLHEMKRREHVYTGVLFVGLMLTPTGPRVIEFNARFGDPETQPLMMLWDKGLLDALLASAGVGDFDTLDEKIGFVDGVATCVVLASAGYPATSTKGCLITGLNDVKSPCKVFHAGTRRNIKGEWETNGGRVLGVCALAATMDEATEQAYAAVDAISFEGFQCRRDIGYQVLKNSAK